MSVNEKIICTQFFVSFIQNGVIIEIVFRRDRMTESQIYYDKMTKTPLTKLIVSLGIPTTISMLVTNIYNMVETYFVGTL